jgi:hypothetical protein
MSKAERPVESYALLDSERIIDPAPDHTPVGSRSSCSLPRRKVDSDKNESSEVENFRERERKISDLSKQLRSINNVCGPINEYIKFQSHTNTNIRVICDMNQLMLLMFAAKGIAKGVMDENYMNISDPPEELQRTMIKCYDNLDSVIESISKSIKEIIDLMQSDAIAKPCNKTALLDEMLGKKNDRLP